jgi:Secretion system C-terminal sorting domain
MRYFIIFITFFCTFQAAAQPGFNRFYDLGHKVSAFYSGVCLYDTLYIAGIVQDENNLQAVALIMADTNGNIISVHPYFNPDGFDLAFGRDYDIKVLPDESIVFLAGKLTNLDNYLFRYDKTGTLLSVNKIDFSNLTDYNIYLNEIELYKDGLLIGGTVIDTNYIRRTCLIYTDYDGEVRWMQRYGHPPDYQEYRPCLSVVDDNTILLGTGLTTVVLGTGIFNSHLFAVDSFGIKKNVEWENDTITKEFYMFDVKPLTDGGLLLVNKQLQPQPGVPALAWNVVVRLDSARNVVWRNRISPHTWAITTAYDLQPSPDGHWMMVEHVSFSPNNPLVPVNEAGCITKFNDSGDIIWQTCDSVRWNLSIPTQSNDIVSALVVLPSGSSVMIGKSTFEIPGPLRTYAWLMKVDANGCMDAPCVVGTTTPEVQPLYLSVYPNPAHSTVSIVLPNGIEFDKIKIYDQLGSSVWQHLIVTGDSKSQVLDISGIPSGIYFLHAEGRENIVKAKLVILK